MDKHPTQAAPEYLIRLKEVRKQVPYCPSTIYLKISRGEFPKPISLGRAVAWRQSDIDAWIAEKIEAGWTKEAA